ncbi:WD40 repeat-like protein [Aaosphaeria arxii CBS 175.79]|uniref:WD40 repeat-like protein n=1 Tax=Aaosphaeria arxii CBS 175.79 TaxID=1450172 RepID=A0A6A5X7D0_9PLEO|nr:WD40 repeat-like protein [Aaosphaeria arxii CBS 175.79]KAF2008821.1 WD40 repeat-like protein [Aaosphaeria arxii CBS 175.79]
MLSIESRPITDEDIGLRVLREAPAEAEAARITDIVAIHGLGAHPDHSWCKNVGTRETPQWVNWLEEGNMLPAIAPNARIMRYGYRSQWFGKEAMQQSASTVAERLLIALKRKRKGVSSRSLLFVAHCFGGLVVLKALLEAEQYPSEWPGVYSSTTGLVFFGTPFRGAGGMNQMEMLEAARLEYDSDQVHSTALEVLQPGNAYLQDMVDNFLKKLREQTNKTQIACFYELMLSNVGRIVGKQDRMRFMVSKSSGCLDLSDAINKYSLSRTHFNMNKFGKVTEEDFEMVAEVIGEMIERSPALLAKQSQYDGKRKSSHLNSEEDKQCIRDLYSTNPRDDKTRIEDTKGGLLADSYRWVLDNTTFQQWQQDEHGCLLWIKGDPGKGKTMLLCGIINELQKSMPRTALLSFFFCQANDSRINSATAVLRGLLYMLVNQQPSLVLHIRKKHDDAGKSLFEDANAWVALTEIFTDVLRDPSLSTTYLIVDALDECITGRPKLLEFILRQSTSQRVKWIVSSRNWRDIEAQLEKAEQKIKLSLELNAKSVAAAVNIFIQQKVAQLAQEKDYTAEIQHAVLQYLTSNANDTFLWVALVCQDLGSIKTANRHVRTKLALFPPGLGPLYRQMMLQLNEEPDAKICRQVLASTALLYRPVTIPELITLVEQLEDFVDNLESVREIVSLCGSFLTLREDTIYFVHQSAKDFLFAEAVNEVFPHGTEAIHQEIFSRSIAILSRTLHRDMYSLKALGFPVKDIKRPDPDPLAASRYPCIHWIDHLYDSKKAHDLQVTSTVDQFLKEKYLYWLEGLSLYESVGKGVVLMTKLWSLVQEMSDQNSLTQLVQDARRFIMYHKGAIECYPLQTYASALLFSPTESIIKQLFQHEELRGIVIKPSMSRNWSACLQTLEGHSDVVNSVAFSHDSTRIASGSNDNTVKIWDAISGENLHTLIGHSKWVSSVAFSYDLTRIASSSWDKTVKIWDASSGKHLHTLESHWETSVAFSHDSTRIASGSTGNTVKIWDASSGEHLHTLKGHSSEVNSVTFSHDSTRIASASEEDGTVKIWDASSGKHLHTLEAPWTTSVAFSHDSAQIASGLGDEGTVKIWDAISGKHLHTLRCPSDVVNSVAFSHDSTRIASGSGLTVNIWDSSSGEHLCTLEGHSKWVSSVAFSHDSTQIASASGDTTVKIWDSSSSEPLHTLKGYSEGVDMIASFTHKSTRIASGSEYEGTVKIWDASSGEHLHTLEAHEEYITSVDLSHDSTRIASSSEDNTVKIWDAISGKHLHTLKGHSKWVSSVAFSHNSTQIASSSADNTVKIWDAISGEHLHTLKGHSEWVSSVAFSHNSAQIASSSADKTVKIWDAISGKHLHTLKGHSDRVELVAFSHNSTQIASGSERTVKIWDASSGDHLHTLQVDRRLSEIVFNYTGLYLYTDAGVTFISNSATPDTTTAVTDPQPSQHQCIALSFNETWITYNSKKIVRLPSEYRPSVSGVSETRIVGGTGSGKLWICDINPGILSV